MELQFGAAQGQIWLRMLSVLCLLQVVNQLFVENAICQIATPCGGEYSLRPLKFLWDLCQVSNLRANVLGPIVLGGILVLLAYFYLVRRGYVHLVKGYVHAVKGYVHLSEPLFFQTRCRL